MPRFKADFVLPSFDKRAYQRALKTQMADAIEEAVRVWLKATVVSLIPVWSGASAATFLHLARAVAFNVRTTPSPTSFFKNGQSYGEARSGPAEPIVYGDRNRWLFQYTTTLRNLIFNEFNNANLGGDPAVFSALLNPGPYHFQARGQAAFQQYARRVRLPNPVKFIRRKPLKVS
jgi:hypothetical protein